MIQVLCLFLDRVPQHEQPADIERLARRLIEFDPYAEAGYRALMRIRQSEGQQAHARALYRKLCARLSTDLQTSPSAETVDLCREINGLAAPLFASDKAAVKLDLQQRPPASVHVLPPPERGSEQYPLARPLVEEVIFSLCRLPTISVVSPQTLER